MSVFFEIGVVVALAMGIVALLDVGVQLRDGVVELRRGRAEMELIVKGLWQLRAAVLAVAPAAVVAAAAEETSAPSGTATGGPEVGSGD